MRTPSKKTAHEIAQISDIDERCREIALKASQLGVFEYDPAKDTAYWDARVHELWGVPANEIMTYSQVMAQIHPDDRAYHDESYHASLDPNGSRRLEIEYRVFPRDGSPMRWIRTAAEFVFEGDTPVRLIGTVQDVSERRTAEERSKTLVRELEHRVKNMLSTVLALVNLSRRGHDDLNGYIEALKERLFSMSHSHDALRGNNWQPVPLSDLLAIEATDLLGDDQTRVTISGPNLLIDARYVLTLSMGVHELFTNALKYGALGHPEGRVTVATEIQEGRAKLIWQEVNGTETAQPEQNDTGFGTFLLTKVLPTETQGEVDISYQPEGLRFSYTFPSSLGESA